MVGRRSAPAGGGALEQQRALGGVARERGRALELRPGLAEAAELGEEVAPHARQEVIAREGGLGRERIDDLETSRRTEGHGVRHGAIQLHDGGGRELGQGIVELNRDRKSTRLNSSHDQISYAVFCLKKKKNPSTTYTKSAIRHLLTH